MPGVAAAYDRRELMRRAAASGVVLGAALSPQWLGSALAADGPPTVRRFRTRPDLVPPDVRVLQRHEGRAPGHLFLAPNSGPGHRGPLLLGDDAEPFWIRNSRPFVAMNFRAGVYRGEPVLTWWEGKSTRGLGHGTHVIVDSSYRELLRLPAGNGRPSDLHEFVLTPHGTALVTAWELSGGDLSAVGGPASGPVIGGVVQELDLPSGRVLFEWRSLDHVAIGESHEPYVPQGAYDYFHINSIELDHDGNYLVSARNTWTVYKIDRGSGDVMWRLGGKKSDFAMGPGTVFAWQHDARRHGSDDYHLSLFDDGALPAVEPQSKALILALDLKGMRATVHRRYTHYPSVLAWALGSCQALPNGNVLVGWGTAPYVTEYASDGKVLLDLRLPRGGENYRALRLPWTGHPRQPPDIVVRFIEGRHLIDASWNGATEVAAWQVGSGTYPRTGFETEIVAPFGSKHVAVTPLDRHGKPLHAGTVVRV
jgi:hypothetical protein